MGSNNGSGSQRGASSRRRRFKDLFLFDGAQDGPLSFVTPDQMAEALADAEVRFRKLLAKRAAAEADAELGRAVLALGREIAEACGTACRAVQAALPCPAAHEAAVFTVRQAFTGLRLQVDALKAALGIRTMARSETFDPARHRVMATRPATDAAQERRVAAVLRDGSEMERGERCVVVEPALVEVFRLEDSHEQ